VYFLTCQARVQQTCYLNSTLPGEYSRPRPLKAQCIHFETDIFPFYKQPNDGFYATLQFAQMPDAAHGEGCCNDVQVCILIPKHSRKTLTIPNSHIFCIACCDSLGLSAPAGVHRLCPACHTALPNPDDAVSTQLNPTEDYKTSVLSGLSPSTIMECAGRALAFWSYQSTQEM